MKKLREILKYGLLIWGAISLIGTLIILSLIACLYWEYDNSTKIDEVSEKDARFVFNGCQLDEARIEKVIHSYESSRSFTGDHFDAYAIKAKNLITSDLKETASDFEAGWTRCDKLDPIFVKTVKLVSASTSTAKLDWFPNESDLLSDKYYIWIHSIELIGLRPDSAKIIFAHPESGILYYASVKN